jgi:hypothetical protein
MEAVCVGRGNHTYVRMRQFYFSKPNCMPTSARFV